MFYKREKAIHILSREVVSIVDRIGESAYWVMPKRGAGFRAAEFELLKKEKKDETFHPYKRTERKSSK